jgi:hypothetical protein
MSGSGRGRPLRAEQDAPMSPAPWLNDIASRSSVRVPVHLSPDWFVGFPVEVVVDGCPGYVDPSMLGISDGLRRDLESFQIWWEAHASIDDDAPDDAAPEGQPESYQGWREWNRTGWELVHRLQLELGTSCEVLWIGHQTEQ